jgi:tight adherence protein B
MKTARILSCVLLVAGLLLAAAPALGLSRVVVDGADTSRYPEISMSVHLPGNMLTDASPAITVWENDVEIEGATVDAVVAGEQPIEAILLLDISGSMRGEPIRNAKVAAKKFVDAMGPDDRVALVSFSDRPTEVVPLTGDSARLAAAIDRLEVRGETALYDGVVLASKLAAESPVESRYIVILSDGGDTVSGATADHAARSAKESGSVVYAVALTSPEYDAAPLKTLTAETGGRLAASDDPEALSQLFSGIADEMRSAFTLRFTSRSPNSKELEFRFAVAASGEHGEGILVLANPVFDASVVPASMPMRAPVEGPWAALVVGVISALVFASVALVAWLGFSHVERASGSRLDSLEHYDLAHTAGHTSSTNTDPSAKGRVLAVVENLVTQRGFTAMIKQMLDRSGMALRPLEFIYFHFLGVLLSGVIVWFATHNIQAFLLVLVVATAGPLVALRMLAARRLRRFETQLPDILSLMASSLRTGWGLQQSIDLVVQQCAEPVHAEFARAQAQVRLGMSLEDALSSVAERLDSPDFRWVVTAIGIQREVGGNLAEVLDTVSSTIRERGELRRHVSSLTAEGRFSALVLIIMPFIVVGVMLVVSPDYMLPMFDTVYGLGMLGLGGFLLLVGSLWMLKLMKVEV